MVFSSLFFVFFFLVICYGTYALARTNKARNVILLVFSLIFYAWAGPLLVLLLAGVTFVCYIGALLIESLNDKQLRRTSLIITIGACLASLIIFKYTGFFVSNFRAVFGVPDAIPQIILPLGISFYTFQLISYVVDVYRLEVDAQKNYFTLLLYSALFHQCIAGPIVRYADVNRELTDRRFSWSEASTGVTRFTVGLAKKALLANGCSAVADKLLPADGVGLDKLSSVSILLGAVFFMLYIYLDFSAYSDMAIGMGLMIGFHYRENFNYPYIATSVTDFWRRWHISLSTFFRDYVYIPLGGNRCSVPRQILNLTVVWLLTGFWHGASWNFVLWGAYYLVFLLIEKFIFHVGKEKPHGIAAILRRFYLLPVVCFGWMLFRFTDLSSFGTAVAGIFTANGNAFFDLTAQTTLLNNCFLLPIAILACTPVVPWIAKKISGVLHGAVTNVISVASPVALTLLSAFALIGNSYNPFLYFNF